MRLQMKRTLKAGLLSLLLGVISAAALASETQIVELVKKKKADLSREKPVMLSAIIAGGPSQKPEELASQLAAIQLLGEAAYSEAVPNILKFINVSPYPWISLVLELHDTST